MNTDKELHGVHWVESMNKWTSQITVGGNIHYFGYYTSKVVAARTRDIYILQNGLPHKLNDESLRGCVHEY